LFLNFQEDTIMKHVVAHLVGLFIAGLTVGSFALAETPATPTTLITNARVFDGRSDIADNADTVRQRTREQLALGASQIKLMAGGGVASSYYPLDVTQFTGPELRAAVEAAENWGTYVAVHAYTPRAI
jgi:imidazolonepropionase-like amidohydrolase